MLHASQWLYTSVFDLVHYKYLAISSSLIWHQVLFPVCPPNICGLMLINIYYWLVHTCICHLTEVQSMAADVFDWFHWKALHCDPSVIWVLTHSHMQVSTWYYDPQQSGENLRIHTRSTDLLPILTCVCMYIYITLFYHNLHFSANWPAMTSQTNSDVTIRQILISASHSLFVWILQLIRINLWDWQ